MDHKLNVKFLDFYRKIEENFQGLVLGKELNLAPKQRYTKGNADKLSHTKVNILLCKELGILKKIFLM